MARFLDSRGFKAIVSEMGLDLRLLLTVALACAVIFVPFAHSSAMGAHAPAPGSSEHHGHHESSAAHHHDDATHCHEDSECHEQAPASSDPCSMCQSHPICHMVVLPEPDFALPAPDAFSFEIGLSPTPSDRSFGPPLAVPRA